MGGKSEAKGAELHEVEYEIHASQAPAVEPLCVTVNGWIGSTMQCFISSNRSSRLYWTNTHPCPHTIADRKRIVKVKMRFISVGCNSQLETV